MTSQNSTKCLRLYLIRHCEIEGADTGRVYGQTDVPLSATGIEQSRRLAERLASERLGAVYSSDLKRASATAQPIAACHNLTVQTNTAWREIDMGTWDGLSLNDLYQKNEKSVKLLFEDPESFQYPDGESFLAFNARIQDALQELIATHASGEVALVTHGGVVRAIIGTVLGMPVRTWLRLAQRYGCLNIIDWYDSQPLLESLNLQPENLGSSRRDQWTEWKA